MKALNKSLIFKYHNKLSNKLCLNKLSKFKNVSGVYQIDCLNCDKFYIGETGRSVNVRMKEHKKDVCNGKVSSGVFDHIFNSGHYFDFDNVEIIYPNSNVSKRHIVESLYISLSNDKCTNLNRGFICLDSVSLCNICKLLKLKPPLNNCFKVT